MAGKNGRKLPSLPSTSYRGDRFRTNFTAGLILVLLTEARHTWADDELITALSTANEAGIPGGDYPELAGSQWAPPSKDDMEDLLRPYCTRFWSTEKEIRETLDCLVYIGAVKRSRYGTTTITDMGAALCSMLEHAEASWIRDHSEMYSPAQIYKGIHPKDSQGQPLTGPAARVVGFSLSRAMLIAQTYYETEERNLRSVTTTPNYNAIDPPNNPRFFQSAIDEGVDTPEMAVDGPLAEKFYDKSLPKRRVLQRKPSYRQFLWAIKNSPVTIALAFFWDSDDYDEALKIAVALEDTNVMFARVHPERNELDSRFNAYITELEQAESFATLVLQGGPEGVWVGKPLDPDDVHMEVTTFVLANRAGFSHKTVEASSITWELYKRSEINLAALTKAHSDIILAHTKTPKHGLTGLLTEELQPSLPAKPGAYATDHLLAEMGISTHVRFNPKIDSEGLRAFALCAKEGCTYRPVLDSPYCEMHGGSYIDAEETASLVRVAQQKIFSAANKAIETMIDLMLHSTNDVVRERAAEQILDRAGLGSAQDMQIRIALADKHHEAATVTDATDIVMERLKTLASARTGSDPIPQPHLPAVIDAELVPEIIED